MLIRFVAAALLSALAAVVVLSPSAIGKTSNAAGPTSREKAPLFEAAPVPISAVANDGTQFIGTFDLKRFEARNGVLYGVGKVEGRLGDHPVHKNVRLPVMGAVSVPNPASGLTGIKGTAGVGSSLYRLPGRAIS